MIITGLLGALTPTRYKWGFFTFGCVAVRPWTPAPRLRCLPQPSEGCARPAQASIS